MILIEITKKSSSPLRSPTISFTVSTSDDMKAIIHSEAKSIFALNAEIKELVFRITYGTIETIQIFKRKGEGFYLSFAILKGAS